jgi:hypothetical protein
VTPARIEITDVSERQRNEVHTEVADRFQGRGLTYRADQ